MQTFPAVYIDSNSHVVIATKNTPSSIYYITVNELLEHTVSCMKTVDFYKAFTYYPNYDVAKAAQKFLIRKQHAVSAQAEITLKEIVMNNSNVIAVNPAAEFLGRFADVALASEVLPSNTIFISNAAELGGEHFTKAALHTALADSTVDLKKTTKAELAELLFSKYQAQEATIMEKVKKVKKEKTESTPREPGVIQKLRTLLEQGDAVNTAKLAEELAKSEATVKSQLNKLKSEKTCGEGGPLSIVSGKMEGKLFYVLAANKDNFEWDAKPEKASRAKGEPRAPKTDGPVYKVHEYLNANPGTSRKDAIAALVKQGINAATASTQYGVWKKARKQDS